MTCVDIVEHIEKDQRMKKKISLVRSMVALLGMVALLLAAGTVEAKSKKKNNKATAAKVAAVKVEGTLQVIKNPKNRISAIKIDDSTGETYNIIVNKKSKNKAKKFDGKAVVVRFKLDKKQSEKKNENWVKLIKIKLAPKVSEGVSEE